MCEPKCLNSFDQVQEFLIPLGATWTICGLYVQLTAGSFRSQSQKFCDLTSWIGDLAEESFVLAVELARALVADLENRACGINSLDQHPSRAATSRNCL